MCVGIIISLFSCTLFEVCLFQTPEGNANNKMDELKFNKPAVMFCFNVCCNFDFLDSLYSFCVCLFRIPEGRANNKIDEQTKPNHGGES